MKESFCFDKEECSVPSALVVDGEIIAWGEKEDLEKIVKKHAEPPVSREKFERRKKVWRAHEKAVLEPFLAAAQDLVDAVERYTRQECLRSELMTKKDKLKELVKDK